MPIAINNFDENIETGDTFTADLTGSDNLLIHGGNALDSGGIATMGQQDLASTNMTQTSIHDLETAIGSNTIVGASGYILDASIPTGLQTFTQATAGTFPDMTHNLCTISGADQTTPFKETSIITYALATPGSLTYNIGANGGLVVLHVTTNTNNITAPSGTGTWTQQGTNKALSTLSQYHIYTRLATSAETGTTVTPVMDGDTTGRGFARVEVWNAAAVAGGVALTGDNGSYAYGGTAASLLLSALLTGDTAAYSCSGTDASLVIGKSLQADTDQYSYTGTSTGLIFDGNISADTAQYAYSGTDAGILSGSYLLGQADQYSYSGTDAVLTFASVGSFTLAADSNSYTYTGTASNLFLFANMAGNTEQYNYSGTSADLLHGFNLSADSEQYDYAGTAAALQADLIVLSLSGSYIITGTAATLTASTDSIWADVSDVVTVWTGRSETSSEWTGRTQATTVWTIE